MPVKKLRALTRLSLWKNPKRPSKGPDDWHVWEAGVVFEPPPHMKVDLAIARGIAEPVRGAASG